MQLASVVNLYIYILSWQRNFHSKNVVFQMTILHLLSDLNVFSNISARINNMKRNQN